MRHSSLTRNSLNDLETSDRAGRLKCISRCAVARCPLRLGFNGAAQRPLQHALPLVYSESDLPMATKHLSPQTHARLAARQQPRRRDPQTPPGRSTRDRRFRTRRAGHPRHRRHLRIDRRTAPGVSDGADLKHTRSSGPVSWPTRSSRRQSAIDRLQSAAHELVLEGDTYRLKDATSGRCPPTN